LGWFSDIFDRNFSAKTESLAFHVLGLDAKDRPLLTDAAARLQRLSSYLETMIEEWPPNTQKYVIIIALGCPKVEGALMDMLVPWVELKVFNMLPVNAHHNYQEMKAKELQSVIRAYCANTTRRAGILATELNSRRRTTPLLLPDEKTDGRILPLLHRVRAFAGRDLQGELARLAKDFAQQSGVAMVQTTKGKFHEIGGLLFKCPAGDGHAWSRTVTCKFDCFLRARMRLGVSINPQFHYDCVPAKSATLPSSFRSCHGQECSPSRAKTKGYVNIAPNDFVR
jgi:hypothetical protein